MTLTYEQVLTHINQITHHFSYWQLIGLRRKNHEEVAILNLIITIDKLREFNNKIKPLADAAQQKNVQDLLKKALELSQNAILAILIKAIESSTEFVTQEVNDFLRSETFNCFSGIKGNVFQYFALLELNLDIPKYSYDFYVSLFQQLLKFGADANAPDSFFKQSPLCSAIGFDHNTAAQALLHISHEAKLDIDLPCSREWHAANPLLLAVQRGNHSMVELLLKNGANVNKANSCGLTSLHWAAINLDKKCIEILLRYKPDTQLKSLADKTPHDYLYLNLSTDEYIKEIQEQLKETSRQVLINGKQTTIFSPNSPANPELRPIHAHYWNDTRKFIKELADKINNENARETCGIYLTVSKPDMSPASISKKH